MTSFLLVSERTQTPTGFKNMPRLIGFDHIVDARPETVMVDSVPRGMTVVTLDNGIEITVPMTFNTFIAKLKELNLEIFSV